MKGTCGRIILLERNKRGKEIEHTLLRYAELPGRKVLVYGIKMPEKLTIPFMNFAEGKLRLKRWWEKNEGNGVFIYDGVNRLKFFEQVVDIVEAYNKVVERSSTYNPHKITTKNLAWIEGQQTGTNIKIMRFGGVKTLAELPEDVVTKTHFFEENGKIVIQNGADIETIEVGVTYPDSRLVSMFYKMRDAGNHLTKSLDWKVNVSMKGNTILMVV